MSKSLVALTSSSADWSGLRACVAGIGVAGFAAAFATATAATTFGAAL